MIAGHIFEDTPVGRICACGCYWRQIASASKADIGQLHIAHTGALNEVELNQILEERDRIWDAVSDVVGSSRR